MAGPSSRVDDSAQHISDSEDDFFNSLLNWSPCHEGLSELELTLQPQTEVPPENQEQQEIPPENQEDQRQVPQEDQLENTDHPPVEAQATGSRRASNQRIASREPLTMERVSKLFHLTEKEAAKEAGWGLASFRKNRKELGIKKWPYRKLKSVTFVANKLQELNETSKRMDKGMLSNTIPMMENLRQQLLIDPNLALGPEAVQARIVAHRAVYKRNKTAKKNREQHQS